MCSPGVADRGWVCGALCTMGMCSAKVGTTENAFRFGRLGERNLYSQLWMIKRQTLHDDSAIVAHGHVEGISYMYLRIDVSCTQITEYSVFES